ncbi:serine protease [Pararhodobacter marinus]|uniref:Serine protease n=1 Tax=Pararhodobacter marinus TaxID=2184063 RepID=A0A2U2CIN3_9RHOB|nr:CAP domain-containing protein [Pararhodobacter marinus]PWE31757.1 serine protease [Pararhodobacter marinus]
MTGRALIAVVALLALAACGAPPPPAATLGPDGRPVQTIYAINSADIPEIQARLRDALNTVRQQQGRMPVEFDVNLTSAAATHARDMSVQARAWHFGSDGSSPIDRVRRLGYGGYFIGEAVSETYETEIETLTAWLSQEDTRQILLDPRATDLGFAWHQDPNGKLWWVIALGARTVPAGAAQTIEQQAPVADTRPNR